MPPEIFSSPVENFFSGKDKVCMITRLVPFRASLVPSVVLLQHFENLRAKHVILYATHATISILDRGDLVPTTGHHVTIPPLRTKDRGIILARTAKRPHRTILESSTSIGPLSGTWNACPLRCRVCYIVD